MSSEIFGRFALAALVTTAVGGASLVAQEGGETETATEVVQEIETETTETSAADDATVEPLEPMDPAESAEPIEPVEPAEAPRRVNRYDTSVQIFSGLTVHEDEIYEEAVAIMGPLTVHGTVEGDAVAIGGPVEITGTVGGELVSVGGPVHLASTARVNKLVNVGGKLSKAEGAIVEDSIADHGGAGFSIDLSGHGVEIRDDEGDHVHAERDSGVRRRSRVFDSVTDFIGGLAWRAVALSLLLFALAVAAVLAPALIDRTSDKLVQDPWKATAAGLLTEIGFLPALVAGCIFLAISIVGLFLLPVFIPLMLLALLAAFIVGFAAVAQRIGRLIADRFEWDLSGRVTQIAVGVAGLYAICFLGWLLGALPGPFGILATGTWVIGFLILCLAWTTGLGALLLAAFDPPQPQAVTEQSPPPPPTLPDEDEVSGE